MSKASQMIIGIVGVIAMAIAGGWFGSGLRSGGEGDAGASSWLSNIVESGELRVGIASAPPMTAEQPDGQMGGPNVIPLQNLAEELGVDFVPVPADWNNIVAGLQADRYDVAAYLDATPERSLAIQFSDAVYTYPGVFAVHADSDLTSVDDIVGAGTVSLAQGTSYESTVRDLGVDVQSVDRIPNAVTSVKSGRSDAAFADLPAIIGAAQADSDIRIVVPETPLYVVDSGYGLPEDIDARSMQIINIAIRTAYNSGELNQAFEETGILTEDNLGELEMQ